MIFSCDFGYNLDNYSEILNPFIFGTKERLSQELVQPREIPFEMHALRIGNRRRGNAGG